MYIYKSDLAAEQAGWEFVSPFKFEGPNDRYSASAKYELNGLNWLIQKVFLEVLRFISIGYALKFDSIRQWKQEVDSGYITRKVWIESLSCSPIIPSESST